MRLVFLLPIAVFAALTAVFAGYLYQVGPGGKDISTLPSALIDKPVPEFTLPPIDGRPGGPSPRRSGFGRAGGFSSDELDGRVTLVNVWASWCVPCRVEHPMLMRLAEDGVPIYGINIKDDPEDAAAFLERLGNPFHKVGADPSGRVAIDWGVYGYPETFVVDPEGRIRYRHVGPIMKHDLDEVLRPMIRDLAGAVE